MMIGTRTAAGTGGTSSNSSTSPPSATSPAAGSATIAASRTRSSAAVMAVSCRVCGSLFAVRQFAKREKFAATPDAEHTTATDPLGHRKSNQLVVDSAIDAGLDTAVTRAG